MRQTTWRDRTRAGSIRNTILATAALLMTACVIEIGNDSEGGNVPFRPGSIEVGQVSGEQSGTTAELHIELHNDTGVDWRLTKVDLDGNERVAPDARATLIGMFYEDGQWRSRAAGSLVLPAQPGPSAGPDRWHVLVTGLPEGSALPRLHVALELQEHSDTPRNFSIKGFPIPLSQPSLAARRRHTRSGVLPSEHPRG